jgi:MFS family permease
MMVGAGILSLSLGWSVGALVIGQVLNIFGHRASALMGAVCLVLGCAACLLFTTHTSMLTILLIFFVIGIGMGFVTLSTLVVVQNCLDIADLGVATASHQFARTLGGTVGIGICGSFVISNIAQATDAMFHSGLAETIPQALLSSLKTNIENLLLPEVQALLSDEVQTILQEAIVSGVSIVFWIVLVVSLLCLGFCWLLPGGKGTRS